jgi:arylsulfatase A-like enzyme
VIASVLVLASLLLSFGCDAPVPVEELRARLAGIERPHIVLILVDTLRPDWTSPYGFDSDLTPELRRWADGGVLFERALAQSSWTKISMASLLTSLWPQSHGIRLVDDGLSESALTLPEILRQAGYRTYGVQSNGWLEQSFGFQHGFERYVFPRSPGSEGLNPTSLWPHAENVLEESGRLLDARDPDEPFFLYLHLMDVHEYAAPPEFKTLGGGKRGAYLASIRWMDEILGLLREQISDAGAASRTIWIFTSDHGESFGEHQTHGHAFNVFTQVLHVPLIIRFPFPVDVPPIRVQVRNLDVAPTVLDLAGIPVPESFQGESLLPIIEDPASASDRTNFAALGPPVMPGALEQVSVTDGTWTMLRNLGDPGREYLFDRKLDPREDVDLLEIEPDQADRMRAILDAHLASETIEEIHESGVRISPMIRDRLKALGYLE